MNADIEVFELPVMVPGNFPVCYDVPVQVLTVEDIEKELQIMDIELREVDLVDPETAYDRLDEIDGADFEYLSHDMMDGHNGADIPGKTDHDPEQDDEYNKEIAQELFIQGAEIEQEKPVEKPVPKTDKVFNCLMDSDKFKELFGAIGSVGTEMVLHIRDTGITGSMVDTANVSLIAIDYKPENFEVFKPAESIDLGIDIVKILKLKAMAKKGSLVQFEVEKRYTLMPDGTVENIQHSYIISIDGTITRFTGLDPSTIRKEPRPPQFELKQKIELSAQYFIDGIKQGAQISDKVALSMDNGAFMMSFDGNTDNQVKNIPVEAFTPNVEKCRSLFSIDYLKDVVKVMNKKEYVTLYMDNDHPLKLVRENDITNITFMLAPRIEAD